MGLQIKDKFIDSKLAFCNLNQQIGSSGYQEDGQNRKNQFFHTF
jgi:hypothetical protein